MHPHRPRFTTHPRRQAFVWRAIVDHAKRQGWLLALCITDFPTASADAIGFAFRLGFDTDTAVERVEDIIVREAERIHLEAARRVRDAIAPLILSRQRSAAIMAAAHSAAAGDLNPVEIKAIVSECVQAAVASIRRRQAYA